MLNFPAWKVVLILIVLVWGALMALPNAFSDGFLGVAPREPQSDAPQDIAAYEQQLGAAEDSWWPSFLPTGKVNLGLDLQGGVYLLTQIDPEEVAANRLETLQTDIVQALNRDPLIERNVPEQQGTTLPIQLRNAEDMDDALRRLRRINPTVGATGGQKVLSIEQTAPERILVSVSEDAQQALAADAQSTMITIIRRRLDPDGVSEISITPQGDTRIVIEAPGEADPRRIKNILSQAGRLTFNMANTDQSSINAAQATRPPPGFELLEDQLGRLILVNRTPVVTGSDIATASQGRDPDDNSPAVDFRLNGTGAERFGQTTASNRGRIFAIVLDGTVMSAPRINEPIWGGNVQITGDFELEEAQDLADIIEAGELPAKLNFIEERTVGPGLGADSIRAGTNASLIGLALVGVFMIIAYGLIGGFAVGSLLFNIVLILGALSGLGATLTLPGIAGIVLTIGMAVDANVIVFERIREEQQNGRSPTTAVIAGYERALSSILDANITTFIAAAILYLLGSGPVKGFAVTLAIGIVTSVFTAFVVTRWFTAMWLRAARPRKLSI
ncbi:MAG: protein translocase subunit SecD [Henriciella sp.]|jgi:protein-export membrane protein SecD|uniref:protein translocase subunit SecD n=1 Tax=Henriciella sp. TaxID=1968823 RepID=UPI000C0E479A|nr:protein translocase subunit SecD [Henriciella sp.]MAN75250.1 protein translocase subunit SecD [Henriciella sp.]MBF33491.1 protein translocase subunit SecD [Hyphomonadaceae bacterium]PHR79904.1 MAG: protein translocase subunit SecD [Henriciella sp.]|tara:strand:- start:21114 stop:22790 length:1677 start_codon:yes stop_codon:yes gene_type:complete